MHISLLNQPYKPGELKKLIIPLSRAVLNYKRLWNLLRQKSDFARRRTVLKSLPGLLMLEATNKCNLKCSMCARTLYQSDRKLEDFDPELFERILEEIKDSTFMVMLWNYGEPFMADNIFRLIGLCRKYRIFSMITTNGFLLDGEKMAKTVDCGLDYLKISCYINKEDDIALYRDMIIKLANTRAGKNHPFIDAVIILDNQPVLLLEKSNEQLKDAGCDCVSFRRVDFHFDSGKKSKWMIRRSANNELCRRLYSLFLINSDGSVYPCCFDFRLEHKLGSVIHNSIRDIWNSRFYTSFRNRYIFGKKPGICIDCHSPGFSQKAYLTLKEIKNHEE